MNYPGEQPPAGQQWPSWARQPGAPQDPSFPGPAGGPGDPRYAPQQPAGPAPSYQQLPPPPAYAPPSAVPGQVVPQNLGNPGAPWAPGETAAVPRVSSGGYAPAGIAQYPGSVPMASPPAPATQYPSAPGPMPPGGGQYPAQPGQAQYGQTQYPPAQYPQTQYPSAQYPPAQYAPPQYPGGSPASAALPPSAGSARSAAAPAQFATPFSTTATVPPQQFAPAPGAASQQWAPPTTPGGAPLPPAIGHEHSPVTMPAPAAPPQAPRSERERRVLEAMGQQPTAPAAPGAWAPPQAPLPPQAHPQGSVTEPLAPAQAWLPPAQQAPSHPTQEVQQRVVPQLAEPEPLITPPPLDAPSPSAVSAALAAAPVSPGAGHWSAEEDAPTRAPDPNRLGGERAGTGPIATHALIVEESADPLIAPLAGTGEILLTGSVSLPRQFATTGAVGALDRDEVDDHADVFSETAPVRAARAVGSMQYGPSAAAMGRRGGLRGSLPVTLAITGTLLAVAVVFMLVGTFMFRLF